jgi:hypothetical protein
MNVFGVFTRALDIAKSKTKLAIATKAAGWLRLQNGPFELSTF